MKQFWPLPILLLLALPIRAQEGDDAPSEQGPAAEPNSSENEPSQERAENAPEKEEPLVSVKVEPSAGDGAEESLAPAAAKKAVSSVTLIKRPRKDKKGPSVATGGKRLKGKKKDMPLPAVVKTKAPVAVVAAPPPLPAVPLTPITPRNP